MLTNPPATSNQENWWLYNFTDGSIYSTNEGGGERAEELQQQQQLQTQPHSGEEEEREQIQVLQHHIRIISQSNRTQRFLVIHSWVSWFPTHMHNATFLLTIFYFLSTSFYKWWCLLSTVCLYMGQDFCKVYWIWNILSIIFMDFQFIQWTFIL